MALTPTPVAGEVIAASWGTEIRNRTVQVFTTTAGLEAWNAPNGAVAFVTGTRARYARVNGAWRTDPPNISAGAASGTTSPGGSVNFTHNLGTTPAWALVQKRSPSSWTFEWVTAINASVVTVLCKSSDGANLANATVNAYVIVGL